MNIEALNEACTQILAHVVTALDEPGAPGAPDRRFVSPGDPDASCATLAVWASPFPKAQESAPHRCAILPRAEISIRHWHCVPMTPNPTTAVLDAAGEAFHTSLWAVWSHLSSLITSSTLIDGVDCHNADFDPNPTQIDRDQGGLAGWLIRLNVDLAPLLLDPSS